MGGSKFSLHFLVDDFSLYLCLQTENVLYSETMEIILILILNFRSYWQIFHWTEDMASFLTLYNSSEIINVIKLKLKC